MKILFITYYFPPYNAIGAIRTGKTAKYLTELGHEVKVISAKDQPLQPNLATEIPEGNVTRTAWVNIAKAGEVAAGGREKVASSGFETSGFKGKLFNFAKELYRAVFAVPDLQVGWYGNAVAAATQVTQTWHPDIIYSSATPYTSHMVAKRMAKRLDVPWVAEFRDLWTDNPYWEGPAWRRALDKTIEKNTLSSVDGMVTISEPLAETLRNKFHKPVEVMTNGFDPGDFPKSRTVSAKKEKALTIVYTGAIMPGKRDPAALLRAVSKLPKGSVKVIFIGKYFATVADQAKEFGCEDSVVFQGAVPYNEALQAQKDADILLLLLWDNPADIGSFTGKVFEYVGSRRPILVIGPKESVASQLIEQRKIGFVSTDEEKIKNQLEVWIKEKAKAGEIADTPASAAKGLTRKDQTLRLERFLLATLKS